MLSSSLVGVLASAREVIDPSQVAYRTRVRVHDRARSGTRLLLPP